MKIPTAVLVQYHGQRQTKKAPYVRVFLSFLICLLYMRPCIVMPPPVTFARKHSRLLQTKAHAWGGGIPSFSLLSRGHSPELLCALLHKGLQAILVGAALLTVSLGVGVRSQQKSETRRKLSKTLYESPKIPPYTGFN